MSVDEIMIGFSALMTEYFNTLEFKIALRDLFNYMRRHNSMKRLMRFRWNNVNKSFTKVQQKCLLIKYTLARKFVSEYGDHINFKLGNMITLFEELFEISEKDKHVPAEIMVDNLTPTIVFRINLHVYTNKDSIFQ